MAEEQNAQAAAGAEQAQDQLQFALQRIYVKDVSFEAPNSPAVFSQPFQPKVALELDTEHQQVGEELFEVSIKVTAQVTNGEDKTTAFLAEVEQAGLFRIAGLSAEQLDHTLGAFCPNVLFPYAREAIDNLVNRGSFPPLMLAPVNFEAMYAQRKQREAQGTAEATAH
ncbi:MULTISPECIES: protein-export chaperone SecB [Cobetia]|uniref:protein-export chaperone SecB n=1 Tax=Cobetia TaxID=204286 RepID=UPI001BC92FA1|nr:MULTISPECIES: protein-export chaperone SecB [Cobetia]MBS4154093.1 protein-export chaperone SecB [Cobetia sp. MC34]MBU3008898.1 protein-export chaperone SecB [Cobetia amphilecti]